MQEQAGQAVSVDTPPQDGAAGLSGHVIICGLSNLGFRIYSQLDKLGCPLVVVDANPDHRFRQQIRLGGDHFLRRDPREPEVLQQAGLAGASALIATFEDDLTNLQIALNAVGLRPDVRIVMRFFNTGLSPSITAALPNVVLLSLSALASPTFVTAATDRYARNAMSVDGQELVVDDIGTDHPIAVGALALEDALVIACRRADGTALLFPAPDLVAQPGDRLLVTGRAGGMDRLPGQLGQRPAFTPPPAPGGLRDLRGRFSALFSHLDRALYVTLAVLLALILISVGIYVAALGIDPLDALYIVILAVSTGNYDPGHDPSWLRPYGVFLLVSGVAALTIIYAFVTNYVVSVKLSGLLGQRPVTMRDHIVLCGLGTVGFRVLEGLLARGERVAVIERSGDSRFLPLVRARSGQVRVFEGDARLLQSLELVNVAEARCIITATDDDMGNIETALNARQLNPTIRVVLRTFDLALAQQMAASFNIQIALSATALAAPAFVSAALGHSVVHSLTVGDELVSVVRMVVPPGSHAAGHPLRTLIAGLAARLLYYAPLGQRPNYRPAPDLMLAPGDILLFVAADSAIAPLKARLSA